MSYYRMIIPSRKRTEAIKTSGNELFPDATILVAENEFDDYAKVVDPSRIVTHPNLVGYVKIFNWSQEHFKEECLVFFDDDIRQVRTTFSRPTRLKADGIRQVIENSIQNIHDLDLSVFCFSRTPNWSIIDPWNKPIVPVQFPTVAFGIRGRARHRKSDEALVGRADMDWGLMALCIDRLFYADLRYYFDNTGEHSAEGGSAGTFNESQRYVSTKKLQDKWGKFAANVKVGFQKNREAGELRMKVNRSHKSAKK